MAEHSVDVEQQGSDVHAGGSFLLGAPGALPGGDRVVGWAGAAGRGEEVRAAGVRLGGRGHDDAPAATARW
nr:hypothetical protein KPHV_29480 [Kitasatospora purpeofusca]